MTTGTIAITVLVIVVLLWFAMRVAKFAFKVIFLAIVAALIYALYSMYFKG